MTSTLQISEMYISPTPYCHIFSTIKYNQQLHVSTCLFYHAIFRLTLSKNGVKSLQFTDSEISYLSQPFFPYE